MQKEKTPLGAVAGDGGIKGHADADGRRIFQRHATRIGLAQALINDPDLVILDEPTAGMDRWVVGKSKI